MISNRRLLLLSCLGLATSAMSWAQIAEWPAVTTESKPGARWWWLGSAVTQSDLTYNLETYAKAGIGAVEITPIYGVINNEKNDIPFLSDKWMQMLQHTESEAKRLGIEVDMNTGTGWPFGGPEVSIEEAATKAIFHSWDYEAVPTKKDRKKKQLSYETSILPVMNDAKTAKDFSFASLSCVMMYDATGHATDVTAHVVNNNLTVLLSPHHTYRFVAQWNGKTRQEVKRAAPGGEGYVMDHFNPKAVHNYFGKFDQAFNRTHTPSPHTFFNDSYEVYGADWTPALLQEFEARRGYKLQDFFPAFLDDKHADHKRILSDYRETLSDLLLEVFTHTWTDWAHKRNAITRNQAHGSPANLLDCYAGVDIPECEGFGLSDFNIAGLRKDSLTKKNDSDLSMLKYASSAAHTMGKPYTTSETFTWLTEHFRTSLSQCKPDMDLMFVSGVNHCFFHGTTYSPKDAAWPGYLFYAAMEMSPINTIWSDAPAFFTYITRCQSFLQWGNPDNDFLVYLPVYDMWNDNPGRLLQFDIHSMAKKAPKFIEAVNTIYKAGYDMDYVSDRQLADTQCDNHQLQTQGGTHYKALIVPGARFMQPSTLNHLVTLVKAGATIVFVENYPQDVPGFSQLQERQSSLADVLQTLPAATFGSTPMAHKLGKGQIIVGSDYAQTTQFAGQVLGAKPEVMKSDNGLYCIRRNNPTGHHYFISSLQNKGVDGWVKLAVDADAAVIYDAMTGKKGIAQLRKEGGTTEVRLQLASGESCILQTFRQLEPSGMKDGSNQALDRWVYRQCDPAHQLDLNKGWTLTFPKSQPAVSGVYAIDTLAPWTDFKAAQTLKGTGRYAITINLTKKQLAQGTAGWLLQLGDVRESAHVYVNGQDAGIAFAVPFELEVGSLLRPGKNLIEIDVTNLAANYVAQMDRQGIVWRRFKNANIANLKGGKVSYYGNWDVMPSGLNGTVSLIPMMVEQ